MARARNIKPSFFKNELLGAADPLLGLLFISLWTLADKEGRLEDRPLRIKAETFPYRENIDINGYLTQLLQLKFIERYEADGIAVIQICTFKEHQSPHSTEKASTLPAKPIDTPVTDRLPLNNESGNVNLNINVLNPPSLNPDSPILNPEPSLNPLLPAIAETGANQKSDTELQTACKQTWHAYAAAYFQKYATEPVRNSKVNGQVKGFVQRLGFTESPQVAAFYLSHPDAVYVRNAHGFGLLLKDAEKLRTEWATNRKVTGLRARQEESTGSNLGVYESIMSKRGVQA